MPLRDRHRFQRSGPVARSLTGAVFCLVACAAQPQAATVGTDGTAVTVDGRAFFVRGAAGSARLAELKALGANTVRTYGEDPGPILDEAARVGLKVIVGLWLEHPRRGFDYGDRASVQAQLDRFADTIRRHKDHPALLMWGIGNEVESDLHEPAQIARIWPAIEEAARLAKSLDPDHPTMAVLAEAGDDKIGKIRALAPSIDVLGVNSYGGAVPTLAARVRRQGWTGPLIATEIGPLGQWQARRTEWGAAIEPTSTEKARLLSEYLAAAGPRDLAGQIVFYWGQKQEVTPTWHSLFLPTGEWTQAMESMAAAWGGRTPSGNRAPRIGTLRLTAANEPPWPKGRRDVALAATDPDGDPLTVRWQMLAESTDLRKAGDIETVPADHSAAIAYADGEGLRMRELAPGQYRIFVTVTDGKGAAATGNLPIRIR